MKKFLSSFALVIFLATQSYADTSKVKLINVGKYNIILETINLEKSPISENDVYKALALAETSLNISNVFTTPNIRIVIHNDDAVVFYSYVYRFLAYYCREQIPSNENIACPTDRTVHLSGPIIEQLAPLFKTPVANIYTAILAHELIHHMLYDLGISDSDVQHCLIYGGMEQKIFAKLGLDTSAFNDFYTTIHEDCLKPRKNTSQQVLPIPSLLAK